MGYLQHDGIRGRQPKRCTGSAGAVTCGMQTATLPVRFTRNRQPMGMLPLLDVAKPLSENPTDYLSEARPLRVDRALKDSLGARSLPRRAGFFHQIASRATRSRGALINSFDKPRTNGNLLTPFVVSLSNHEQSRILQSRPWLRKIVS